MKKEKINSTMNTISVKEPIYSSCSPLKNIFNTLNTQLSSPVFGTRKPIVPWQVIEKE